MTLFEARVVSVLQGKNSLSLIRISDNKVWVSPNSGDTHFLIIYICFSVYYLISSFVALSTSRRSYPSTFDILLGF